MVSQIWPLQTQQVWCNSQIIFHWYFTSVINYLLLKLLEKKTNIFWYCESSLTLLVSDTDEHSVSATQIHCLLKSKTWPSTARGTRNFIISLPLKPRQMVVAPEHWSPGSVPLSPKKTNVLVQGRCCYEEQKSLCFLLVCSVPGSVLSALRAFSYLIFTDVPFDHIRGSDSRSQHCRHASIVISTLILRMRKLNLREVKSPAKGHTA